MVNVMAEQISSLGALATELLISKIVLEKTPGPPSTPNLSEC